MLVVDQDHDDIRPRRRRGCRRRRRGEKDKENREKYVKDGLGHDGWRIVVSCNRFPRP